MQLACLSADMQEESQIGGSIITCLAMEINYSASIPNYPLAVAASQPKGVLDGLGPKRISADCSGLCLGHGCRSHRFFDSTMAGTFR